MGIYPNHGIDRKFIVANTAETDDRLLKSKYLEKRYNECFRSQCIPLQELDIELTDIEKIKLEKILSKHDDKIYKHGWYDVCSISTTYGPDESNGYYVVLNNGNKIKVTSNKVLNEHDTIILNSILNVYDNKVKDHGYQVSNNKFI